MDCLSAPSPYHHYHPTQRFSSQLSLCLGHPPPPPPPPSSWTDSHFFIPHSSTLPLAHPHTSHNCAPHPVHSQTNSVCPTEHIQSQTLPNGTHFHRMNLTSNGHLLSDSYSYPGCFPPTLSLSSPNLCTLPYSMSTICSHTMQNIQLQSNSNLKTSQIFPPGCQTNPSSPVHHPESEHPTGRPCGRPPPGSAVPLSPTKGENVPPIPSFQTLPLAHSPPHVKPSHLPITNHSPSSERPVCHPPKAGVVHVSKLV